MEQCQSKSKCGNFHDKQAAKAARRYITELIDMKISKYKIAKILCVTQRTVRLWELMEHSPSKLLGQKLREYYLREAVKNHD